MSLEMVKRTAILLATTSLGDSILPPQKALSADVHGIDQPLDPRTLVSICLRQLRSSRWIP